MSWSWAAAGRVVAIAGLASLGGLAACSRGPEPRLSRPGEPRSQPLPRARLADASPPAARHGGYKLGAPYRVAGRWYFPAEDSRYDRRGIASWYGADFHGRRTANGEVFDMHALTAAHPTLPLPSLVYVTNLANGRTVLVRVNDRGPYVPGRIIDLSRAAARAIGAEASGVADVRVTWAGRAPLDGNDVAERRFLASQPWARDTRMGLGRW